MHREAPVPRARAARGTSRSSTEQRPSEQSCSAGKRQRQPEQQWDTGPGAAAAAEGAAGREGAETWPEQLQDPFWHWSHWKCKVLAREEGWPHTPLSPAVTYPWRQPELSPAPGWEWPPHLHSRRRQQELLSLCSNSQAGPAVPSLQGIPSHSRPLWCPQQEEDPWQPLWVPWRCGANKEVLSCSSRSGDGHGKTSTRNLLLFLPSPSPCETFCAWFFPALQGPVRQTWLLFWGMWGAPLSPAGSISPCAAPAWAPGEAV